ncbi:MAG: dynamin family protein, partial [Deltaproteobacteria bacterium]|nr:dynamin family protein [Deltaproteobacteria bacterium]
MDEKKLQAVIQNKVQTKLSPLLARYNADSSDLQAMLKWKPIVLILGNYSSGKSTFINELAGREVQRTGQAPTDDAFTVITAPDKGNNEADIPGANLVNDERLPFTGFKAFGEQFIAHFRMKTIAVPTNDTANIAAFTDFALIDSPGMLDSVSERDRGYDYSAVVKEFAKLADLIILMFDPLKAGTIQETYNTIRNTLPEATGEDRIVFVMSRIDECDNLADLVRSYGTLCWNLSQMTGRKDIPRIYLTYAPSLAMASDELAVWATEREELKQRIRKAPGLRVSHVLQNVDKQTQELHLIAEAMWSFAQGGKKILAQTFKRTMLGGGLCFLFLDMISRALYGFPHRTFFDSLLSGMVEPPQFIIPLASFSLVTCLGTLWFLKWQLPRYLRRCRQKPEALVVLDTAYRKNVWGLVRGNVEGLLAKAKLNDL